jgi:hypothetical protein
MQTKHFLQLVVHRKLSLEKRRPGTAILKSWGQSFCSATTARSSVVYASSQGEAMSGNQRIILLNRLISRSVTKAPREHKPPLVPGAELLKIVGQRKQKGFAVEYLGAEDDTDDAKRLKKGSGHDCFRLSQIRTDKDADGVAYWPICYELHSIPARNEYHGIGLITTERDA